MQALGQSLAERLQRRGFRATQVGQQARQRNGITAAPQASEEHAPVARNVRTDEAVTESGGGNQQLGQRAVEGHAGKAFDARDAPELAAVTALTDKASGVGWPTVGARRRSGMPA